MAPGGKWKISLDEEGRSWAWVSKGYLFVLSSNPILFHILKRIG